MGTKVIEEYNSKREGNDCLIYTDIILEEVRDYYVIVYIKKMIGWFGVKENANIQTFSVVEEAQKYFNELKSVF